MGLNRQLTKCIKKLSNVYFLLFTKEKKPNNKQELFKKTLQKVLKCCWKMIHLFLHLLN